MIVDLPVIICISIIQLEACFYQKGIIMFIEIMLAFNCETTALKLPRSRL